MKVKSKKVLHMLFTNWECSLNKNYWPTIRKKIRWVSKEGYADLYYFLTAHQDD